MGDLERDCRTCGGQQYRTLLAVSQAIVSHRDLPRCSTTWPTGSIRWCILITSPWSCTRRRPTPCACTSWRPPNPSHPDGDRSSRGRRPGGVGLADPAAAHHLERGRAEALAAVAGTGAAVWGPELLLAAADHGPAAAGHAGVHVQAAVRLRRGGPGLPAAGRQPGGRGRRERPGLPGDRRRSRTSSPRRRPTWRRRSAPSNFGEIVAVSAALREVLKKVETVAPTDSTVLICGETGTGKELIARALHDLSPRRERTFVKLNCAAIPTGLLESELFGHEKGAFTGAIARRSAASSWRTRGRCSSTRSGDIPLELQPKLLRVLQEQEFERLGGTKTIKVDVRLVAATNRDLAQMVAEGRFRSDLYYRLNVFPRRAAAAARAAGRHPVAGPPLHPAVRPADGPADRDHPDGDHGRAGPVPLAGQRPGAAERHRAGGHPLARPDASGPPRRLAARGHAGPGAGRCGRSRWPTPNGSTSSAPSAKPAGWWAARRGPRPAWG